MDAAAAAAVPNYLVQSILVALFCCQPLGIVAIVFAAISMSKRDSGDYAGAIDAAAKARLFCLISLGIAITLIVLGAGVSIINLGSSPSYDSEF